MTRPRKFNVELATTICDRLADGETLRGICRDEGMPRESSVRGWAMEDAGKGWALEGIGRKEASGGYEGFASHYARSRQIGYDVIAEQLLDIADDGSNDWMERELESGRIEETVNHEHISRSRLRVDTRKWLLAKMLPKRYGDRAIIQGDDDADPIKMKATVEDARSVVRAVIDLAAKARTGGVPGANEVDSVGEVITDNTEG